MIDVLIVGAGPSGLAAAIKLHSYGKKVRIIDIKKEPLSKIRAISINPQTLFLLDQIGIAEKIINKGIKIESLQLKSTEKTITTLDFKCLDSKFNFVLSLPQNELEKILIEELSARGIFIERESQLVAINENNDDVVCTIEHKGRQEKVKVSYLVGADGLRSTVRKIEGFTFDGYTDEHSWSLLDAKIDSPSVLSGICMSSKGLLIVMSIKKDRYCAVASCHDIEKLFPNNVKIKKVYYHSVYHVGFRQTDHYQTKRVFLIGDAAHIFPPVSGRGMNLGIEDGIIFSNLLIENRLYLYEKIRRPFVNDVLKDAEILVKISHVQWKIGKLARDYILGPLIQTKKIQRSFCLRFLGMKKDFISKMLMGMLRFIIKTTV